MLHSPASALSMRTAGSGYVRTKAFPLTANNAGHAVPAFTRITLHPIKQALKDARQSRHNGICKVSAQPEHIRDTCKLCDLKVIHVSRLMCTGLIHAALLILACVHLAMAYVPDSDQQCNCCCHAGVHASSFVTTPESPPVFTELISYHPARRSLSPTHAATEAPCMPIQRTARLQEQQSSYARAAGL